MLPSNIVHRDVIRQLHAAYQSYRLKRRKLPIVRNEVLRTDTHAHARIIRSNRACLFRNRPIMSLTLTRWITRRLGAKVERRNARSTAR